MRLNASEDNLREAWPLLEGNKRQSEEDCKQSETIGRNISFIFLSLKCMEYSSHQSLVHKATENWLNFQDVRPEQPTYSVTFNGQLYQGLEAGQIVEGLKMALESNPRVDISIVLENSESQPQQPQLPA